ncbi:hypothetical protein RRG08_032997 [Elysia crispata]|uniref:Uncharacterized protein n=1 Tax=Elysia crispata TaxID=231223 RepID=A0AAE0YSB8_9GAST|nr:hypothetical protein RRG08_032997 [Elysia crispata]
MQVRRSQLYVRPDDITLQISTGPPYLRSSLDHNSLEAPTTTVSREQYVISLSPSTRRIVARSKLQTRVSIFKEIRSGVHVFREDNHDLLKPSRLLWA